MSDNKVLKVKWLLPDKRLLKLFELEDTYNVAEDVNLEGIDTNVKVKIAIKDNVVVAIAIQGETKKETTVEEKKAEPVKEKEKKEEPAKEPKAEEVIEEKPEAPAEKTQTVTWTLSAFTTGKDVVKFEEQPVKKYWFPVHVSKIPKLHDLNKGDKVTVVIGKVMATNTKGVNYEKDGIVDILGSEKTEKEEPAKEPNQAEEGTKAGYKNSTNNSIERQVALKEAGAIIRAMIATDTSIGIMQIQELLLSLTKTALKAMNDA